MSVGSKSITFHIKWLLFPYKYNTMWWVLTGLILYVPLSPLSSSQNDVISKLCTCAISLAIYLSLCKVIPVEHSINDEFVKSTPFYLQVIYLYLAMLALRPKYYFVWTLGELHMMSRPRFIFLFDCQKNQILTFLQFCFFGLFCTCLVTFLISQHFLA